MCLDWFDSDLSLKIDKVNKMIGSVISTFAVVKNVLMTKNLF